MDKKQAEELKEKLFNKKENAWKHKTEGQKNEIFEYAKGYISFMNKSKTEREVVTSAIEMVKAIGVPYRRLRLQGKHEYVDTLIEDIQLLMKQYNIELPIVDTSRFNYILVGQAQNIKKRNK